MQYTTKQCRRCGEVLPVTQEHFFRHSGMTDGYENRCKVCSRYNSSHFTPTPTVHSLALKRATKERARDLNALQRRRRRARIASASGEHSKEDIPRILILQKKRCWWCGEKIKGRKYHVDHRIPITRGGSDNPENLVISCPECNLLKHTKLPQEFAHRLF
jgi:5-methylcytosine-specific restriction endonuclease McrA